MPETSSPQGDSLPWGIANPAELTPEPLVGERTPPEAVVNASPSQSTAAELISTDPPRCWYCGVGEAIAWFVGILVVQLGSGIGLAILFIAIAFIRTGRMAADDLEQQTLWLLAGGESILLVVTVVAISIRYWGRTRKELNFSPPELRHVAIVVAATLPMAFCISALYEPVQMAWNSFVESHPQFRILDELSSMKIVKDLAKTTNLPVMILIVAVMPAIVEEILFRGAIGRVLIANLGIWIGVLATSFLFGWCHVHPVHALAVMPVGLALHYVYLTTRSFWVPMLLHFANNCWASILLQYEFQEPVIKGSQTSVLDGIQLIAAAAAVVATALALRQSRVRYYQPDGSEWSSPRFPTRVPASPGIRRMAGPIGPVCLSVSIVSIVVCHLALVIKNLGLVQ